MVPADFLDIKAESRTGILKAVEETRHLRCVERTVKIDVVLQKKMPAFRIGLITVQQA